MEDCVFCKIIAGEIPGKIAYEDEDVFAFHDIDAKAPVHVLVVPKKHVKSILELQEDALGAKLLRVVRQLAEELQVDKSGFRVVCNTGEDGGQSVAHLHFHLLGGRALGWPPG